MGKKKSVLTGIGAKISILPILGLLGIFIIQGTQIFVDLKIDQALDLERKAREMIQLSPELLLKETEFINQVKEELIPGIATVNQALDRVMTEILSQAKSESVDQRIDQARKALEEHRGIFEKSKEAAIKIKDLRLALAEHFRVGDDNLRSVIEFITQEETNLMMSGDELPGNKVALRDAMKEYLGFSLAQMLNVTDLLAFADAEAFKQQDAVLKEKIALAQRNTEGMVASVPEKEIKEKWTLIKKEQEIILKTTEDIFSQWSQRRDLTAQLNQNVILVQEKIKGIEIQAGAELVLIQNRGQWTGRISVAVILVLLSFLSLVLVRRITKPIKAMTGVLDRMADGDFSQRFDYSSKDEIGRMAESLTRMGQAQANKADLASVIADGDLTAEVNLTSTRDSLGIALQKMVAGLNEVIGQINQAVSQIASGSGQVSDSSQSLSQGATEQAASLEEITSSMTEMASQTKNNAENASQANQLSISARQAAETGNNQMQEMISAMEDINSSSKEIAKIIKTIDEIAFQTNLLALNAAVEAARAGKHGQGFAVVAQEVRNLASRSAKAAQETSELIEGAVKKVGVGTNIVNKTAEALDEIVKGATKAADLVAEIAAASNEQAQGITQVNQGLSQVEQVTQQNTANAEQTAAAAEELSGQAAQLSRLVARFRLKDEPTAVMAPSSAERIALPEKLKGAGFDGWGEKKPARAGSGKAVYPRDVISLGEDDFGKY